MMSEPPDFFAWGADEDDPIDKIDSCIQIVSTSPSSNSHSSHNLAPAQSKSARSQPDDLSNEAAITISKSCDDLLNENGSKAGFSRSQSCHSLTSNPRRKYDHVQSKIKQYIDILNRPVPQQTPKQPVPASKVTKEEYLEEINNRLIRELEEKNATLLQLQENYEHLLLKYAEAQNKIDNLRFMNSSNAGESSNRSNGKSNMFIQNAIRPKAYPYSKTNQDCQWAVVAPFTKVMGPSDEEVKIDRPSTLAVDTAIRRNEKEGLKAVTPTDSEGVSSVVTSMSGHSKILTNLDEKDGEQNKKMTLKSDVLEKESLPVNDPFDKVKHWQNSLPPLEMIETPDTGLYDLEAFDPILSLSTRYNELPVSELENIPETPEWTTQSKAISQLGMKKYLRTLSLPSSLTRRNMMSQIYKRRNNHTIDVSSPIPADCVSPLRSADPENTMVGQTPTTETLNHSEGILRRKKRPPFLRSASLPVYDYESPRSIRRCQVPPLDLDNLTLSEDETSPVSKSNVLTSPSFLTSHECSYQTLNSLNSCKATVSDYSLPSLPRQSHFAVHKSTSITPDRSKEMFLYECVREPLSTSCNVCGEALLTGKAASFHGLHAKSHGSDVFPICRSVSFNTETSSPTLAFTSLGSNSESFEVFTNNLKTRSQITMKALTAHVTNSQQ